MSLWSWLIGIIVLVLAFGSLGGCAIDKILSSGPDAMSKVADGQKSLMIHAMDGLQASTGQMSARGSLRDPTYRGKTFVGTGVYFDMELSLQGVELTGQLMASLVERVSSDPALRADIIKILHNTELQESQKRDAIMEVVRKALDLIAAGKPDQPSLPLPDVEAALDIGLGETAVDGDLQPTAEDSIE